MRISELYTKIELFYIQPLDSNCTPGTFGCDAGTHRGTLKSAIDQAKTFSHVSNMQMKVLDAEGNIVATI